MTLILALRKLIYAASIFAGFAVATFACPPCDGHECVKGADCVKCECIIILATADVNLVPDFLRAGWLPDAIDSKNCGASKPAAESQILPTCDPDKCSQHCSPLHGSCDSRGNCNCTYGDGG